MDHRVRYIYLRDNKKAPQACVAVLYSAKNKKVAYGLSVLNPQDRFNRKVARELAAGRLALYGNYLDLSEVPEINCHVITRRILTDLLTWEHEELPGRARKSAKRWLAENEEIDNTPAKIAVSLAGGDASRVVVDP